MGNSKISRHSSGTKTLPAGSVPKGKRTFSLSREALAYLDSLARTYRSASEALDVLIREKKEEAQKEEISASIRGYYDSIDDDERAESRAWGEFVHSHLAKD